MAASLHPAIGHFIFGRFLFPSILIGCFWFSSILIGCLTSKSEALFTSRLFFHHGCRKSFCGIEGILKDNAITQNTKMQQKVVKLLTNYNLLTICLTI